MGNEKGSTDHTLARVYNFVSKQERHVGSFFQKAINYDLSLCLHLPECFRRDLNEVC